MPAFGQNNIKKTAAITYTLGPPTYTVLLPSSSEIAVDTSTGKVYQYHRTNSTWLQIGQGIDVISGSIPPAYTPVRNQSLFAINAVDSLYHYRSGAWRHLNAGGSGVGVTDGDKGDIDVTSTGTVWTVDTSAITTIKVAANAIDSTKVINGGISVLDLGQHGASSGQVLKWNGTQWAPAADTDTGDDWGSQVVEIDATLVGDGTSGDPLGWNGAEVDGPLTGNGLNATPLNVLNLGITEQYIGAEAVTSSKIRDTTIVTQDIKDAAVTGAKIAQAGATSGQVLKWNGTTWAPADDNNTDAVDGSGAAGQVTTWLDGNTVTGENNLFWDAVNNRLGINTTSPNRSFSILSSSGTTPNMQVISDGTIDQDVNLFEMVGTATGPYVQRGRVDMDVYSAAGSLPDGHSMNFVLSRDGGSTYTAMALYNYQALFNRASSFTIANNTAELRLAPNVYSQIRMYHTVLVAGSSYGTLDTTNRFRVEGRTQTSATNSAVFNDGGAQRILTIRDDRKVGIKTTTPARELEVNGEVRITDLTTDAATGIVGTDADGDLSRLKIGNNLSISNDTLHATTGGGVTDHGALTGLADDDHTQYALLAGRAGGQTLTGGTASGNNLTLNSTSNSTKGAVLIGTDNSQTVVGTSLYFRGDLAPSALSADTDNWNPAGLDTAQTLRISSTDTVSLTGIQGGSDGRILYIFNIGETPITLKDNTTSTSAYRFEFDADIELRAGQGVILRYDGTASKWRAAGSSTWARSAVSYLYTTEQVNTAVTVPTGARMVSVICIGGGGGGGSGRRGAAGSVRGGGSGGQAGFVSECTFAINDLGNPATLYVNVGGGGDGGTAATSDDTNGNNGTDGGDSDVRTTTSSGDRFMFAGGGNNGGAGDNNGTSTSVFGVDNGMFGGSNGGASSATGGNGTSSANTGFISGGGGGGGVTSGNSASNGGNGNASCQNLYSSATGGAGGASGANGTTRTLVTTRLYGQGGGGGGGGSAGTGGTGGNGIRGGGGGGGGASTNGNNSGAGGDGGDGLVRLIFYF